jgi:choline dehydrogenase-like flavoprotein
VKKAIVVGSGAGGATIAKELQGLFEVTVVEAGREFRPFSRDLSAAAKWKKSGLLFDEREISLLFPAMRILKTKDMVLVRGQGLGGTTTISTGNALRLDNDLRNLGICLDEEFEAIGREIPISVEHEKNWRPVTRRLFDICRDLGLSPQPTPKMGDFGRCRHCGHCVLGCPHGVKWDSRLYLDSAVTRGARLISDGRVTQIIIENGTARGVGVRLGRRKKILTADVIILAAGGLGTPLILERSGIPCEPRLFVDPVLCVAAEWKNSGLDREIPMPFVVEKDGYIISPYFDFLSFFFNRRWSYPPGDIMSLMIKLADRPEGSISSRGVQKTLFSEDRARLDEGVALCRDILYRLGIPKEKTFLGTINAGHPGGMLPLTERSGASFHPPALPENLYVADASLFPRSLGKPPILTIAAMAKRVARICRDKWL